MKKKILVTIACICIGLVGCGSNDANTQQVPQETSSAKEDTAPTPVPDEELSNEGKVKKDKETVKTAYSAFSSAIATLGEDADELPDIFYVYMENDGISSSDDSNKAAEKLISEINALLGGMNLANELVSENAVGRGITCHINGTLIEAYCTGDDSIRTSNE